MHSIHLCCCVAKLSNLKSNTRPKQIYSSLPGESRHVVHIIATLILLRICFNNQGKYSPHIIFFVTFYGCNLQVKPELGFQLFKQLHMPFTYATIQQNCPTYSQTLGPNKFTVLSLVNTDVSYSSCLLYFY